MLKDIGLENYKCFKDRMDIEIKPLTVLCGTNSSGKSSILKSLLLLKQSYENIQSTNSVTLNGKYTNNGSMSDIIFKNSGKSFIISNTFVFHELPSYRSRIKIDKQNVAVFKELIKVLHLGKNTKKIEMTISLEISKTSNTNTPSNVVSYYNLEIRSANIESLNIILEKTSDIKNRDYNLTLKNFITSTGERIDNLKLNGCACYFEGMKLVNIFCPGESEYQFSDIFPNICSLSRHAAFSYYSIKHISPLRIEPLRYNIFAEDCLTVGNSGENTAKVIQSAKESLIRFIYPPKDDCFLCNSHLFTFKKIFKMWAEYLGLGDVETVINEELLKLSINNHNVVDVGFGISQVLPIIVECLLLYSTQTLLIEQPEIHLHPKMQMNMADFLIAASNCGSNLIIETHSDHIINRIVRRIMEDTTGKLNKLIKIYFVENVDGESKIYDKITVTPTEGLINAPAEFFTQFGSETMRIAQIGLKNYKDGIKKWQKQ